MLLPRSSFSSPMATDSFQKRKLLQLASKFPLSKIFHKGSPGLLHWLRELFRANRSSDFNVRRIPAHRFVASTGRVRLVPCGSLQALGTRDDNADDLERPPLFLIFHPTAQIARAAAVQSVIGSGIAAQEMA